MDKSTQFLPNLCTGPSLLRLVAIVVMLSLVLALNDDGGLQNLDWMDVALSSLLVLWVALASAACICRLRPWLSTVPLWGAVAFSYGLILIMTLTFALLGQWFYLGYWWTDTPLDWYSLAADVFVAAIFAGIGLQYFYLQQQLGRRERAELEARIQALQSRIRPHFLFNSMNSIASLIAIDAARAERMVVDLSALFRASLSEASLVPVEQELALGRRYLDMEAARLGDKLQVNWQVEALPEGATMPSLMLQPLLENAIYHGIGSRKGGGLLEIAVRTANNRLTIEVRNPLGEGAHKPGNGLALNNIRARLDAHFGRKAECAAAPEQDHFIVRISYPLGEDN